jgi:NADPH:quinone reductase-like Zn-dependent oxidoreductase
MGEPPELLELPEPASPGPGELLIEVQAAGIGPWDAFVGAGGWDVGLRPPAALGVEGTGVVAAVGENVGGIAIGDAVLVHEAPLPGGSGFWAEQVLVDASHVARRPAGLSPVVAGGLPVAGLTAMQALRQLEVAANTRLLVTGASGVTGAIAVQLAAELNATIVATAAARRVQRLVGFGAAQVIDSHEADWAERVEGEFDAALVAVRGTSAAAMTLVRDGGRLCAITSDAPSTVRGIESTDLYVRPDADQLTYLVDRCAEGRVELDVSSVALADGPSVAERVIAGQSGGRKYVLLLAHW